VNRLKRKITISYEKQELREPWSWKGKVSHVDFRGCARCEGKPTYNAGIRTICLLLQNLRVMRQIVTCGRYPVAVYVPQSIQQWTWALVYFIV